MAYKQKWLPKQPREGTISAKKKEVGVMTSDLSAILPRSGEVSRKKYHERAIMCYGKLDKKCLIFRPPSRAGLGSGSIIAIIAISCSYLFRFRGDPSEGNNSVESLLASIHRCFWLFRCCRAAVQMSMDDRHQ